MGVIGDTLAEARARRAVDLDEVHAVTGIRTRYLRAIEEEDWDALPEEFYARSFIRKYAQFLGVDPEPLVEDYRRQRGMSDQGEAPSSPFARTNSRRAEALRRRRQRQGIYAWAAAGAAAVAVIVVIVLLVSGGGGGSKQANGGAGNGKAGVHRHAGPVRSETSRRFFKPAGVVLAIEPTAEVWACVLGARGRPLVDGAILAPGEMVGPFHSRSYTAAFGNGQVAVTVDGEQTKTPETSSPMGFTVDRHGKLRELPEGRRPTCE